MQSPFTRLSDACSPLNFLVYPGAGGLTMTFFMWLMHQTMHPGRSLPEFEDIITAFAAGGEPHRP